MLLLALFATAALLAAGSLALSIRTYAVAALDIGRQLEACSNPKQAGPGKSPLHRRSNARLTCRAAPRRGVTARGLRRDRIVSAPQGVGVHKISRRQQFVSPGSLVFE